MSVVPPPWPRFWAIPTLTGSIPDGILFFQSQWFHSFVSLVVSGMFCALRAGPPLDELYIPAAQWVPITLVKQIHRQSLKYKHPALARTSPEVHHQEKPVSCLSVCLHCRWLKTDRALDQDGS